MATFARRDFRRFEADPTHADFARWPIKRLTGVEIELVGNTRRCRDEDDNCGCGNECGNGPECSEDDCDYCHADHSEPEHDSDSAIDRACSSWSCSVVHDGSIGDSGIEIVSPAMAGHHFPAIVQALCTAIARDGLTANHACGLHVHADARDLSWYDMRRIMLGYMIAEPFLRLLVPARRRNTTYARDCGRFYRDMIRLGQTTKDTKREVIDGLYGIHLQERGSAQSLRRQGERWTTAKQEKYAQNRYKALNVHSWVHRGTLEWRLPPGTRRASSILGYARTFHDLIRWSLHTTERELWKTVRLFDGTDYGQTTHETARNVLDGIWSSDWTSNRYAFFAEQITRRSERS